MNVFRTIIVLSSFVLYYRIQVTSKFVQGFFISRGTLKSKTFSNHFRGSVTSTKTVIKTLQQQQQQQRTKTESVSNHFDTIRRNQSIKLTAIRSTDHCLTTSLSTTPKQMKLVTGCKDLIDKYDIFLLDMWGVMHDGSKPYKGVIDAVEKLKNAGKCLIVLSNSSKRREHSINTLNKLGFNANSTFDQIITSGEVAFQILSKVSGAGNIVTNPINFLDGNWYEQWDCFNLRNNNDNNNNNNNNNSTKKYNTIVLGSGDGDDIEYCTNCGWTVVSSLHDVSLIIARGTFSIVRGMDPMKDIVYKDRINPELYNNEIQTILTEASTLRIPMLICNPDKVRPDSDRSPMPGRIGELYKAALKDAGVSNPESFIKSIGKPFPDVYNIAMECCTRATKLSIVDMSRVCMVGDALETDVAGGTSFGIDTVWVVKDGVYQPEFAKVTTTTSSDGNDKNDNDTGTFESMPGTTTTSSSIEEIASDIVTTFNKMDDTYASPRQLYPTYIMPHFRWE